MKRKFVIKLTESGVKISDGFPLRKENKLSRIADGWGKILIMVSTAAKFREKNKEWLMEYKYTHCCEICGFKEHPEILQFHHKELVKAKGMKRHQNQGFTAGRSSIENMKKEMKNCLLLCPNCHMWLHYSKNKFDYR